MTSPWSPHILRLDMSYNQKSAENLELAEECLAEAKYLSAGVNRAYYATYHKAKEVLISHGVENGNYWTKAEGWSLRKQGFKNPMTFGHESIWDVLKACLKVRGKGVNLRVNMCKDLRSERETADYDEVLISPERLSRSIHAAQSIIDSMRS